MTGFEIACLWWGFAAGLFVGGCAMFAPEILGWWLDYVEKREKRKMAYLKRKKIEPEYNRKGRIINAK